MNNYLSILILAVVFIGCTQTRSISNSGYQGTWGYRGELIELEVLGFNDKQQITEGDIKKALKSETKVSLKSGDRVVLVQSGAQFPDGPMLKGMEPFFRLSPLAECPLKITVRACIWTEAMSTSVVAETKIQRPNSR